MHNWLLSRYVVTELICSKSVVQYELGIVLETEYGVGVVWCVSYFQFVIREENKVVHGLTSHSLSLYSSKIKNSVFPEWLLTLYLSDLS